MDELLLPKVTVILRGYTPEQALCIGEQLVGSKLNSVEVASNSPEAMKSIAQLKEEFGNELHVGAGTITSVELEHEAISAGAEFLLSPICFNEEMFAVAKDANVITVPAAMSPTEIQTMFNLGADIVKVFPAAQVTPAFFKAVQAPLGKLPLMAVGGINVSNAKEFFAYGASYVGIGSGLFNKDDVLSKNASALKASIKQVEEQIAW